MDRPPDVRRPPPLRRPNLKREITLILIVKTIAIGFIWKAWFSTPQDEHLDGPDIGRAVYAVAPPLTSQEEDDDASRHGSR